MKIAVFTPTKRAGGIDIIEASLARQTYQNFDYFVLDELERDFWWEWALKRHDIQVTCIKPPFIKHVRNLAKAYNLAAEYAVEGEYDLLVSLQDYLWLPPEGLDRFAQNYERNGDKYLYTGLTSISLDPEANMVYDRDAPYSIFEKSYYEKPQVIDWTDARIGMYREWFDRGEVILEIHDPNHFEANWAAIPTALFKEGLRWDEEYDKGVAFENNNLALDAMTRYDSPICIDGKNHAISLPHKKYWPEDEDEATMTANKRNMDLYLNRSAERGYNA